MTVRLTRLNLNTIIGRIVGDKVYPTTELLTALNTFVQQGELTINQQPIVEAAAEAANTAAAAANEAVEQIQAGTITIAAIKNPDGTRAVWDGSSFVQEP